MFHHEILLLLLLFLKCSNVELITTTTTSVKTLHIICQRMLHLNPFQRLLKQIYALVLFGLRLIFKKRNKINKIKRTINKIKD